MVFSSVEFIFLFLPATMAGFWLASHIGPTATKTWLAAASLAFYAYWRLDFLPMLLASIAFNYLAGRAILRTTGRPQTALLAAGIAANLLALAYYKYAPTLAASLGLPTIAGTPLDAIILPLGISFFTFTQIAYLADAKLGTGGTRNLVDYTLFVTFFPHLIAGPILHHREMIPQFNDPATTRFTTPNLAIGATIFVAGLAKKVLLADPLAADAAAGFNQTATVGAAQAWASILAYALQLYFDFSGYSDMAIGLARMFNIRFPLNFNSPYKATSIIDFWQRWHMTLTRWINQYLYTPQTLRIARARAQRKLPPRSIPGFTAMIAIPTLTSMGLAGIWHGAGTQYLAFGLLHGAYLVANHATRTLWPPRKRPPQPWPFRAARHAAKLLATYLAVLLAFVFFRAPSFPAALDLLAALAGAHGTGPWPGTVIAVQLALLHAVVWTLPNTQQIMAAAHPALGKPPQSTRLAWRPTPGWAAACGLVAAIALLSLGNATEFLYFQF